MTRKKWLAVAATAVLLAMVSTARADAATPVKTPAQVRVYLENNNHNPGSVTVTCGETGPVLHTAVFNDADGANAVETAKIYREDGGAANAANWPVVWGPSEIPIGGSVNVALPYVAGTSYNAVAVPQGDPWPTTLADLIGRLSAKPPTADNSQLFPSGYPLFEGVCKLPPPPNPCATESPMPDLAVVVPTCPPCPAPETKDAKVAATPTCVPPTTTPSATPTTPVVSTTPTVPPTTAATLPVVIPTTPGPTGSAPAPTTSVPTGPTLAHTGSSAIPYAAGASAALIAGVGLLVYTRRVRRH